MVVIVKSPAQVAEYSAQVASIKTTIENMKSKGLDPTKFYDLREDKIIDLTVLLFNLENGPKIAL